MTILDRANINHSSEKYCSKLIKSQKFNISIIYNKKHAER